MGRPRTDALARPRARRGRGPEPSAPPVAGPAPVTTPARIPGGPVALAGLLGLALAGALALHFTWGWHPLAAWCAALAPVTFLVYGWDKNRAESGGRRVPERVLLGLALAGGWFGAVMGMTCFRHKTRKASFGLSLSAIIALHLLLGLAWLLGH